MTWDRRVPVSLRDGGILHDTDHCTGIHDQQEWDHMNAVRIAAGRGPLKAEYVMQWVAPFRASLRFEEIVRSGHTMYATFVDVINGAEYPVGTTELENILKTLLLDQGVTPPVMWEVCKRGQAYGVKLVHAASLTWMAPSRKVET